MFSLPSRLKVRLPLQREAGGHIKSHWNVVRGNPTPLGKSGGFTSADKQTVNICHNLDDIRNAFRGASCPLNYSCPLTEWLDEGTEEAEGRRAVKASAIPACLPLSTAPSGSCSAARCCQNSPGRRARWCGITPW